MYLSTEFVGVSEGRLDEVKSQAMERIEAPTTQATTKPRHSDDGAIDNAEVNLHCRVANYC
jgi:hypothetical protein